MSEIFTPFFTTAVLLSIFGIRHASRESRLRVSVIVFSVSRAPGEQLTKPIKREDLRPKPRVTADEIPRGVASPGTSSCFRKRSPETFEIEIDFRTRTRKKL